MTQTTNTLEMPQYRAVVVVDMKDYSSHSGAAQRNLTEVIPELIERAFHASGHGGVWEERRFPDTTGDGYAVGFRPEVLPVLVGPFLDALQDELAYYDKILRTHDRTSRMRWRVAITVGPLHESDSPGIGDGCGDSRVEAHRLVDAGEVRRLLDNSDPDVTFVAAIISSRVHEDVIAGGYATKTPSDYARTSVSVKSYRGDAYLYVPKPSGELLAKGFTGHDEPSTGEPRQQPRREFSGGVLNDLSGTVSGGSVVQAGTVEQIRHQDRSTRFRFSGDGNTVAGRDITGGRS
jgi:hypothetical protein